MKKIDFRKVSVKNIDGEKKDVDVSKELGNQIFQSTGDLGELELAREIYKHGEVEVDAAQRSALLGYVKKGFKAFIQEALCPVLEEKA